MSVVPEMGGAGGVVAGNLNGFNKLPVQHGKCVFAKTNKIKIKKNADPISLL